MPVHSGAFEKIHYELMNSTQQTDRNSILQQVGNTACLGCKHRHWCIATVLHALGDQS